MQNLRLSSFFAVLALASAPLVANSLSFTLEPQQMLPALPPAMSVRISDWPESKPLPEFALWVEPNDRPAFFARTGDSISPASRELDDAVVTRVGNELGIYAPMAVTMQNIPWFADYRLCTPGTYVLRLVAREHLRELHGRSDATLGEVSGALISTPVTFTVTQPSDDDLAVWKFMRTRSEYWSTLSWSSKGPPVAEFVWKEYPKSRYAPFVANYYLNDQANTLRKVLDAFPGHALTAEWHFELGRALGRRYGSQAIQMRDRAKAERLFAEAKEHLEKAATMETPDVRLKKRAEDEMGMQSVTANEYLQNDDWWEKP